MLGRLPIVSSSSVVGNKKRTAEVFPLPSAVPEPPAKIEGFRHSPPGGEHQIATLTLDLTGDERTGLGSTWGTSHAVAWSTRPANSGDTWLI